MFCERFQQYWPFRVPVKCCVRLSFILVAMAHHLVTILETAIARAPPYEDLAGITFHFLSVVGMVLCGKKDAWMGEMLNAEGVRTSLLDAGLT